MEYRKRRWVTLLVIGVSVLALGVLAAIFAAVGDRERIDGYWASAEVRDGDLDLVNETIDYDFGVSSRHGIYRDVPGLQDSALSVTVSSPTAPDQFVVEPRYNQEARIRVGDPDRTIIGRHRYRIGYEIALGSADRLAPGSRISWNAVGDRWEVSIRDIELHLVAPAELSDLRCSKGEYGSWDGCTVERVEPGHVMVTVDKINSREGITISAEVGALLAAAPTVPAAPGGEPDDPGSGVVRPALVALLAGLVGAVLALPIVRRAGRELVWAGGSADAAFGPRGGEEFAVQRVDHDDLADLATTEFVPPEELSAWQGGVLLAERTRPDHRVAWLLSRGIEGQVEMAGEGKNVTLSRTDTTPDDSTLISMFGGRDTISLRKYDPQFSSAWKRLEQKFSAWQAESEYWDAEGDRRKTRARIMSGVALFLALFVLAAGAALANFVGPVFLVAVAIAAALAGFCFAVLLSSWELRVRTPHGSGLWLRAESFRRFIRDSDARHVEQAADMGMLLEYTAWAVALGEAKHWAKNVEKAGLEPSIAGPAMHYAALGPNLSSATRTAATAPSSSGGGGGGSVGGGGGGGGGGSW